MHANYGHNLHVGHIHMCQLVHCVAYSNLLVDCLKSSYTGMWLKVDQTK